MDDFMPTVRDSALTFRQVGLEQGCVCHRWCAGRCVVRQVPEVVAVSARGWAE